MTAAFPDQRAGRLLYYHFRGLLGVHIILRPVSVPIALRDLSIERFSSFVTSATVPIATGWNDYFAGRVFPR